MLFMDEEVSPKLLDALCFSCVANRDGPRVVSSFLKLSFLRSVNASGISYRADVLR